MPSQQLHAWLAHALQLSELQVTPCGFCLPPWLWPLLRLVPLPPPGVWPEVRLFLSHGARLPPARGLLPVLSLWRGARLRLVLLPQLRPWLELWLPHAPFFRPVFASVPLPCALYALLLA